jgi:hypothetical protein
VDVHLDNNRMCWTLSRPVIATTATATIDSPVERVGSLTMLNGLAAFTGLLCALVGFAALALGLVAAGSGHAGWAMVAAAVLLSSLGIGIGFVATVVHYDHRHHYRTPRLF